MTHADEVLPQQPGPPQDAVDQARRRFLTLTTAVVGGAGVVAAAIPFIESWQPSARALAAGAPVTVDIGKIESGQMVRFAWRSLPIFVVNRTREQLADLPGLDPRLRDPHCKETSQQPPYCQNTWRSIKPEWLVMIGICTHLGCVPDYYGQIQPEPFDAHWKGGFFCPCHKSRYDVAGRVFQGVPAPLNMVIPPYHYLDATHVRIGVNPKGAA